MVDVWGDRVERWCWEPYGTGRPTRLGNSRARAYSRQGPTVLVVSAGGAVCIFFSPVYHFSWIKGATYELPCHFHISICRLIADLSLV